MNGPAAPVARLERVTQRYRRVAALDDVTIAFPAGRMVGLIGPDGVGKSSLLAIVAGRAGFNTAAFSCLTAIWPIPGIAARFVRVSPICRKAWERTFIPTSASVRISRFSVVCSGSLVPNGTGGSPSFSTAPGSRRSPIARRRSCRAACGRNSACAARSFTIPTF